MAQSGEAGTTVLEQLRKDLVVDIVKTQKYYLAPTDNSIVLALFLV
jgi:hypothetical protein